MDESDNTVLERYIQEKSPLKIVPLDEIPLVKYKAIDQKSISVAKLCILMENFCLQNNGIGLSAVQVGIPFNIFVASKGSKKDKFFYFFDCEYEGTDEKNFSLEGCLSILNKNNKTRIFKLERFKSINLNGFLLNLQPQLQNYKLENMNFSGYFCNILQHEIDHANNILISNIGKEMELY
jgi:peptide deformylase